MRRPLIAAVALASVLGLVAIVAAAYATWTVRRSFPAYDGELVVAGLDGDVTVHRDRHGIPQIYADSAEDLFTAQGYVHAQDRVLEMDVRRHVTAGRLAEFFGEDRSSATRSSAPSAGDALPNASWRSCLRPLGAGSRHTRTA